MDFKGIDLNLLAAFDALMREQNVTRAAALVGVSQPAMSAALGRLRTLFGDPLFLRNSKGLLPTQRARDLAEPLSQALRQIEATLVPQPVFDAREATLLFNLGMSDYAAHVVLPSLMLTLAKDAPGVTLNVHAFSSRDDAIDLLDAGSIDVAIGVMPTQSDRRIVTRPIFSDTFVTIVGSANPVARRGMNMKTWLAMSHVLASPEGERHGLVDQALAQRGKQRTLGLTLPHMFAVPSVVARTQMTATLMKRVALRSPDHRRLVMFAPPVTLPEIVFHLIWHRRADAHPAQQWLRETIAKVAAEL